MYAAGNKQRHSYIWQSGLLRTLPHWSIPSLPSNFRDGHSGQPALLISTRVDRGHHCIVYQKSYSTSTYRWLAFYRTRYSSGIHHHNITVGSSLYSTKHCAVPWYRTLIIHAKKKERWSGLSFLRKKGRVLHKFQRDGFQNYCFSCKNQPAFLVACFLIFNINRVSCAPWHQYTCCRY